MSGFKGTNYFGNHIGAPQILQGTPNYTIEVSEGCNPPGEFYPATYLPTVVSENRIQGSAFVLMPGKVVAFDKQLGNRNGRLITAGLANDYAVFCADEGDIPGSGSGVLTYSALDEQNGVVGPTGQTAVAGQEIASLMFDSSLFGTPNATGSNGVTVPIGIMRYSALMAPGTDPSNPATFYKHSYDTGGARAFSRWAYIQIPVLEVNARIERIAVGKSNHRIALYEDGTALVFKDSGGVTKTVTKVATVNQLADPSVAGVPDQYAQQGRTLFFNAPIPVGGAGWTVEYVPVINTPFTCLKVKTSDGAAVATTLTNAVQSSMLIGESVGFDFQSNFGLLAGSYAASGVNANYNLGRILDVKNGSDKDLALVLTWYRDQGLWQEQPGSATDGRNTQLALTNAPRFVARIAVDFTNLNTWYV